MDEVKMFYVVWEDSANGVTLIKSFGSKIKAFGKFDDLVGADGVSEAFVKTGVHRVLKEWHRD